MTLPVWLALAATALMVAIVVAIVVVDVRHKRRATTGPRKTIPRDLPEEGRWR